MIEITEYQPTGNLSNPTGLTDTQLMAELRAAQDRVKQARNKNLPRSSVTLTDAQMAVNVFASQARIRDLIAPDAWV